MNPFQPRYSIDKKRHHGLKFQHIFLFLQITFWTSLQRRCHKKFWLIRGTKWGEVKAKEAQPPLQLLRRHNLHHFQPRANPNYLSWVGGWSTDFILLTGIFNDISLGAECCFPFQILWPLFIFSSTQPTTFSWYYLLDSQLPSLISLFIFVWSISETAVVSLYTGG